MKITVPETRGRNRKYHFRDMAVGESQSLDYPVISISSSAKYWAKRKGWKVRCYTDAKTGRAVVIRTK